MSELVRGALYPVLPLRDIVVFPHMIVPLFVGREKSVRALEDVMKDDKQILLVTQKNAAQDDPSTADIYHGRHHRHGAAAAQAAGRHGQGAGRGRAARADRTLCRERVVLSGLCRQRSARSRAGSRRWRRWPAPWSRSSSNTSSSTRRSRPRCWSRSTRSTIPAKLADTVASHLTLKIPEKQELLETEAVSERLEKVFGYMEGEIGVLQVEKRIRNRVKRQMEKTQREYYLNEQLKAIQKELGEGEDGRTRWPSSKTASTRPPSPRRRTTRPWRS